MEKITLQSINALFDYLSKNTELVFWIRSLDYKRQLYVGPTFEDIWGKPLEQLYEHPDSWYESLIIDDVSDIKSRYNKIHHALVSGSKNSKGEITPSSVLFRINRPDGEQRWIKDRAFLVVDENNKPIAVAGIGESITENEWTHAVDSKRAQFAGHNNKALQEISYILDKELKLHARPLLNKEPTSTSSTLPAFHVNGQPVALSKRERQCLYYLFKGFSAKETGTKLFLSQRTIEEYIAHAKQKIGCRTKIEILSRVQVIEIDG